MHSAMRHFYADERDRFQDDNALHPRGTRGQNMFNEFENYVNHALQALHSSDVNHKLNSFGRFWTIVI